jgi:hypothetical protein
LEKKTSDLLASAEAALGKINKNLLSGDGKAQWDAANSFVTQAKAA